MNPVALINLLTGLIAALLAVPLIRQKVKMNHWYGVRTRATFASDEAWYEINRYGGWSLLGWGLVIAATGLVGFAIPEPSWNTYNLIGVIITLLALVVMVILTHRHTRDYERRTKQV
ncbi:SdpI family protein [Actomonas aquatica]|uniref:SdpI family protein n=1 Tax=Actomonas aquatica TaxID=2866162 RepID=A0ABZ1C2P2_9BACT|nr:SdpI family protein [Opitutus sp. WL0086]WRQ85977.1 SdpI family protein [Opitutus sp. WL0086]